MQNGGIRNWPTGERPREKLLQGGADRLSDAELLAVLLGRGTRGASAVDLARHLLQQFGGVYMDMDILVLQQLDALHAYEVRRPAPPPPRGWPTTGAPAPAAHACRGGGLPAHSSRWRTRAWTAPSDSATR